MRHVFVAAACITIGSAIGYALPRPDLPPCKPRVVHVTRVVHVHDPGVNELVYLAGRACKADGGIARGSISIYPAFPGSYDYFCSWNDIAVKSNGLVVKL